MTESLEMTPFSTYFRHLLRFRIECGNETLKQTFSKTSDNAKYTSKTVQNELLSVMSCMVKQHIVHSINQARVWGLLADETTDRRSHEQMVLVARYVDKVDNQYVVREDPFSMTDVFEQIEQQTRTASSSEVNQEVRISGANIARLILHEICKANLDVTACVGQGYDKASTMAGEYAGAAAITKNTADLADYFHCVSHATNQSCSKCTLVPIIRNAQHTIAQIINCFNASAKRVNLLQRHSSLDPEYDSGKLTELCTTRFVERHSYIPRFWKLISAVVSALHDDLVRKRRQHRRTHTLLSCPEKK